VARFHVTNIVDSPGNPGFLRITWASQPGMAYQVENSVTLAPDSWVPMHPDPLVATTAQTFWDAATFGDSRFYRVRSIRPNPLITVP